MSKRFRSNSATLPESDQRSRSSSELTTPPPDRTKILRDNLPVSPVMQCSLPPHELLSFASYDAYEVHYLQVHVNRCSQCGRNFPTGHFLNLHIEENHDPLVAALKERGEKTYSCFVETCEKKCSTPQKRRLHLIDRHLFPRSYNFYIVNDGIDKQTSLLRSMDSDKRRRRISAASISSIQDGGARRRISVSQHSFPLAMGQSPMPQTNKDDPDDMDIDGLEKSMSALRFVPASVTRNKIKAPPRPS
ncbi:Zinc finger C2H2 [Penicillium chermesinum]|uniref:Zinc finger C2H2 n=1 Tax=Penicillium chermesinum TaxID=63820 RepID=A0A9W9NP56_9EURO|nr:Zinc finger C2H2 [Penicillium chermesinum]KAJ5223600.1 Zinc finger C2H2 [Penicillium chermesinum]